MPKFHITAHCVRGNHRSPVDSPHKVSIMKKNSMSCRHHEVDLVTTGPHFTLEWRHNGRDGVSNYQPHDCLLNRLFGRILKKTSKLRVTGPCAGISPVTGEFTAQMASNAEKVFIWWRHIARKVSGSGSEK